MDRGIRGSNERVAHNLRVVTVATMLALAVTLLLAGAARASWSAPEPLSTTSGTTNPQGLEVSSDWAGDSGVVWNDGSGDKDVSAAFRTASGSYGSAQVMSGGGTNTEPTISLGAGGAAIIGWHYLESGEHAIQSRSRSSALSALGSVQNLIGPAADAGISHPDVDAFDSTVAGELGVAAFGQDYYCAGNCYWHIGGTTIESPSAATASVATIEYGGWQNLEIETAADGTAIVVGKSDICCNQRTISVGGRTAAGSWSEGGELAVGYENDPGCLCGSIPRIARLPGGGAAIVYTRKSSPGDDVEFAEFSFARAVGTGGRLSESNLSGTTKGSYPDVLSDSVGDLLVAWRAADGRYVSRYRPHGGSFEPIQTIAEETAAAHDQLSVAMGPEGTAYAVFVADGEVEAAARPSGAGSSWGAPQPLTGTGTVASQVDVAASEDGAELAYVAGGAARVFASTYTPPPPPSEGGEGGGSSSAGSTPAAVVSPSPVAKPISAPSNRFSLLGKLKRAGNGSKAIVFAQVPGPGKLIASSPKKAKAGKSGKHGKKGGARKRPLMRTTTVRTMGAGQVRLVLKLTGLGKQSLNKHGRLKLPVKVTFKPASGKAATQKRNVVFKKSKHGKGHKGKRHKKGKRRR